MCVYEREREREREEEREIGRLIGFTVVMSGKSNNLAIFSLGTNPPVLILGGECLVSSFLGMRWENGIGRL